MIYLLVLFAFRKEFITFVCNACANVGRCQLGGVLQYGVRGQMYCNVQEFLLGIPIKIPFMASGVPNKATIVHNTIVYVCDFRLGVKLSVLRYSSTTLPTYLPGLRSTISLIRPRRKILTSHL